MLGDMNWGQSCSVLANLTFLYLNLCQKEMSLVFSEITSPFIGLSPYVTILIFMVHNFHPTVADAH